MALLRPERERFILEMDLLRLFAEASTTLRVRVQPPALALAASLSIINAQDLWASQENPTPEQLREAGLQALHDSDIELQTAYSAVTILGPRDHVPFVTVSLAVTDPNSVSDRSTFGDLVPVKSITVARSQVESGDLQLGCGSEWQGFISYTDPIIVPGTVQIIRF